MKTENILLLVAGVIATLLVVGKIQEDNQRKEEERFADTVESYVKYVTSEE